MNIMYVDISQGLRVWALNDQFQVIKKETFQEKPSMVLHSAVWNLIEDLGWKLENIHYIFNKGPGSYTGLRLLQGFEDVLSINNLSSSSIHSFEVLKYLDSKYLWISKAFKGEFLISKFDRSGQKIIHEKLKKTELDTKREYIGFESLSEFSINNYYEYENEMLEVLKQSFKNKYNHEVFYYRSLEEEFKK